jgi:pyrimidine-specific ribonucleoside hydrolase
MTVLAITLLFVACKREDRAPEFPDPVTLKRSRIEEPVPARLVSYLQDHPSVNTDKNLKKVWIDTDLSVGMKRTRRPGYCDVDDGYAVLQLMKSNSVRLTGISSVFGNTDIDNAYRLCQYMAEQFYDNAVDVYKGAAGPMDIGNITNNDAVEAMAAALSREKMTIMAIGPATNVGILLALYPDLASRIDEVVLVAGRRKQTDAFHIGNKGSLAMDLNFDLDNAAFQILLQSGVKVVLCPFEISSKVWITDQDLAELSEGDSGNRWLASHSVAWIDQWKEQGAYGFNPFDVLATHYILHPRDIISEPLNARLELYADDTQANQARQVFKNYLICDKKQGYPVLYCHDVVEGYHQKLLDTFKSPSKFKKR